MRGIKKPGHCGGLTNSLEGSILPSGVLPTLLEEGILLGEGVCPVPESFSTLCAMPFEVCRGLAVFSLWLAGGFLPDFLGPLVISGLYGDSLPFAS